MSFSAKVYDGDLPTFLERSSLEEITSALYQQAIRVEDGRASGLDFYSELRFALEQMCERGIATGRAIEKQKVIDHANVLLAAIQAAAALQPTPEGTA